MTRSDSLAGLTTFMIFKRLAELSKRHQFGAIVAIWPRFLNDRIDDIPFMPNEDDDLVIERLSASQGIEPSCGLSGMGQRRAS